MLYFESAGVCIPQENEYPKSCPFSQQQETRNPLAKCSRYYNANTNPLPLNRAVLEPFFL